MAFVVEDGTGLANANAYVSVAYVRGYLKDRGRGACLPPSDTAVEQHIVRATDYVDMRYGLSFYGGPLTDTQSLAFPRLDGEIPESLKRAVAEYTVRSVDGELAPDVAMSGQTTRKKLGKWERETEATGAQATWRRFPAADRHVTCLLKSTGSVVRA